MDANIKINKITQNDIQEKRFKAVIDEVYPVLTNKEENEKGRKRKKETETQRNREKEREGGEEEKGERDRRRNKHLDGKAILLACQSAAIAHRNHLVEVFSQNLTKANETDVQKIEEYE